MNELTILTAGSAVRIIRPVGGEDEATFRRRMEAMTAVLTEYCNDTIAVFLLQPSGNPACVVTQSCAANERQGNG